MMKNPMTVGRRLDGGDVILRDRKLGRTYNRLDGFTEQTNVFINNLKETHPSVINVLLSQWDIRLLDGADAEAVSQVLYRRYCLYDSAGTKILDKLYKGLEEN